MRGEASPMARKMSTGARQRNPTSTNPRALRKRSCSPHIRHMSSRKVANNTDRHNRTSMHRRSALRVHIQSCRRPSRHRGKPQREDHGRPRHGVGDERRTVSDGSKNIDSGRQRNPTGQPPQSCVGDHASPHAPHIVQESRQQHGHEIEGGGGSDQRYCKFCHFVSRHRAFQARNQLPQSAAHRYD